MPMNAEKAIFVEKKFALRVFGIGYGCQALRAPYYLAYVTEALALGVEDPSGLDPYGKRLFLRERKRLRPAGMLPSTGQEGLLGGLHVEEVRDEEEGRASKRIKATAGSSPSSLASDS